MSYYLADATGYMQDFASIGGLDRLAAWAVTTGDSNIRNFFDNGEAFLPERLANALSSARQKTSDPIVLEMLNDLIDAARRANSTLVLSDGADDSGDEPEALIGNGNNQYRHDAARKQLDQLQPLSHGDPNFRETPFKQVSDTKAEQLEFMDITHAEAAVYDPSRNKAALRSTQDYVEADKVEQLIARGNKDKPPTEQQIRKVMKGQNTDAVVILRHGGKDYIIDGHHRMTAALFTKSKLHIILTRGR